MEIILPNTFFREMVLVNSSCCSVLFVTNKTFALLSTKFYKKCLLEAGLTDSIPNNVYYVLRSYIHLLRLIPKTLISEIVLLRKLCALLKQIVNSISYIFPRIHIP